RFFYLRLLLLNLFFSLNLWFSYLFRCSCICSRALCCDISCRYNYTLPIRKSAFYTVLPFNLKETLVTQLLSVIVINWLTCTHNTIILLFFIFATSRCYYIIT